VRDTPGGGGYPTFTDALHPTDALKPPTAEHPEDFLTLFQESLDAIDPGSWVLEAINSIFGSDPIEQAMEKLGGDWQAYGRVGDMFEHLGEFFEGVGTNLKIGNDELDGYWMGTAADSAYLYFDDLAERTRAHKAVLHQLADQYRTASSAAYHFAIAGGPIAAAIVDAALVAGIGLAAGTAAAETGVGAAIGYGVAAFESYEVIEQCDHLLRLIGLTDSAVQGVAGQVGAIIGTSPDTLAGFSKISTQHDSAPPLPGGGG
jgi:hypothetical protein